VKSLISKVLSEKNEFNDLVIKLLKKTMKSEHSGVINSIVPEFELIVGPQKELTILSRTQDIQKRLFESFDKFFDAFSKEGVLVFAIDDLQWSDSVSFQYLEHLLRSNMKNIFIVGAYRDNEINPKHPLMDIMNEFKFQDVHLRPLNLQELNMMISETLNCSTENSLSLSELIHIKTLGNPFFSREFINTLHEEELLYLHDGIWEWNLEKIEKKNFSSNVIDFMIGNLQKQPKNMQKLLNKASCIGNTFTINELKWIWEEDTEIEKEMIKPLEEGWIFQFNTLEYKFFHDKLQQASYEFNDEKERKKIHSIIGHKLLEHYSTQHELEQNIFNIVNHLNNSDHQNVKELLDLNIIASKRSLECCANEAALKFAKISFSLLSEDCWEKDYNSSFKTYLTVAEVYHSNVCHKEAEETYNSLLEKVQGRFDKLTVYSHFMKYAAATIQFDKAYLLLVETLKMFDLTKDIPFDDIPGALQWAFNFKEKVDIEVKIVGGLKNLSRHKLCEDKELVILLTIILESLAICIIATNANPIMLIMATLVSLYLFLTKGFTFNTSLGLAAIGWIYSFFFKDPNGRELTRMSEYLYSMEKNPKYNICALKFFLGIGNIFSGNVKQCITHLKDGEKHGIATDELIFSTYCSSNLMVALITNGDDCFKLIDQSKKNHQWFKDIKNNFLVDFNEVLHQYILDLTGSLPYNPQFLTPGFTSFGPIKPFTIFVRGMLHYHKGEFEESLKTLTEDEACMENQNGFFNYYDAKFYHCLLLIHFEKKNKDGKNLERIQKFLQEFELYGKLSEDYLYPRTKLLNTFYESLSNENKIAMLSTFEDSLEIANKMGLKAISAVATEIILDFCEENKFPKNICKMYFDDLLKIWSNLSVKDKCDRLKRKYSKYVTLYSQRRESTISYNSMTSHDSMATDTYNELSQTSSSNAFDMMSIVKASQALSREVTTSGLKKQFMSILIENTGAERGLLFLMDKEDQFLECSIVDGHIELIHKATTNIKDNEYCCTFLVNLCKTIKKTIVINNISESEYADNGYMKREKIKSLCIHPIIKGQQYIGSIYLENKTMEGIFDEERREVLGHLSSQIAISHENAKFYDDMQSLNASYERFLPKEFLKQLGKGDVRNIQKGDAATKDICVLFSDIRSFTDLTEKMNPKESFSFVNEILSYLAPIISKNNGFIDKFFGDCIMALFPYSVDDSIKCGHEMLLALEKYNQECRVDLLPVKIGIGIHYGDCMLGTIGAEERIDMTVISDTVNTASRVESLTKTLGATFVVTNEVLQHSKLNYQNRYIGKYLLKGKEIPIALFQILSHDSTNIEEFSKGMECFESRKLIEAENIFEKLKDKTSMYLLNVVKEYKKYSFDENWTGEIKIDKDGNLLALENKLLVNDIVMDLSKEEKKKIWEDVLKNNNVDAFLQSMLKENPEKLQEIIQSLKK
jgi:class 3 adenylate cyclase